MRNLNRSRILKFEKLPHPDPVPDSKFWNRNGVGVWKIDSGHLWLQYSGAQNPDFGVQSGQIFWFFLIWIGYRLPFNRIGIMIIQIEENVAMQKILLWNNSRMRKNYDILKSYYGKSTCLISLDRLQCSLPLFIPTFRLRTSLKQHVVLRSVIPSGICAELHTVAASNNRIHMPWSLYYFLFAPHICMVLFFTHIPFVVNHTINATPPERLQLSFGTVWRWSWYIPGFYYEVARRYSDETCFNFEIHLLVHHCKTLVFIKAL